MNKIISATQIKSNIYNIIDETAITHEPILITGKKNNAVIISQEDWSAIEETIYLNSIPNMAKTIQEMINMDNNEFSEKIVW